MPENTDQTYDAQTGQAVPIPANPQQVSVNLSALMSSPITWLIVGVGIGVWLCKSKRV